MSKRAILIFCLLTFVLGWGVQLGIVAAYGNPENAPSYWLILVMSTPAIATVLFAIFHAPSRRQIRWKPTWRMWPMTVPALCIPILIGFGAVAAVLAFGWGTPGWFQFSPGGVQISGGPWLLGKGAQGWAPFVANVVVTGVWFAAISTIPAIGEELGWRGLLQGALIDRLGLGRGVVVLGLVWSFWHLPSLLAGYNYPDHPVLGGLLLFPLMLIGASLFLAWLTLRAGSFWPAAFAHGAGNSIEIGVISNLKMTMPQLYLDVLHLTLTLAAGLICFALLRRSRGRGTPEDAQGLDVAPAPAA
ncbi:CPBP family intramembrane glutamic endopeptidase [Tahibacter caeni]|uniref:CPBP family intramembrane glutamic endopeptidase n=1 Tax=Tahibacter caeni TaxID=1453545 RepID=UPI002149278A|nr:CPBP family intramembrane glutamic endopeptidase [Tahibacter caeni]